MQKRLNSLLGVCSFVAAATLVFIACGSGDMIVFTSGSQLGTEVQTSGDAMKVKIEESDTAMFPEGKPKPPPPESSWEVPLSSAVGPPPVSSSVVAPPPLSSSLPPPPLSSSSYVIVLPSSSGSPPIVASSSSRAAPVPVSGCKESNPKAGFSCQWDGWVDKATLVPGKILKPAAATPPSGCSSIEWKFADDTTGIILNNFCEKLPEAGTSALGSRNYVLFAELTCEDGKHTTACKPTAGWSSKIAPTLSGECKWSRNPTTSAKGATPSGVSVVDPDKVCSSPTVVYKYESGAKDWNLTTGILTEWGSGVWKSDKKHKETYKDVTPTLNCAAYSESITVDPCPALEVSAGADYTIELDCSGVGNDGLDKCKGKNEAVLSPDKSCVEMYVINYTGDPRPAVVECNVDGNGGAADVTLKGTTHKLTGYYGYFDLGNFKSGENEFGTLCLTSTGSVTVKCKISKR